MTTINNVIKIQPIFLYHGETVCNTHYFIVDEFPDPTTANELAASYKEWWNTYLKPASTTQLSLRSVKWTIMENFNDPAGEYMTGLPLVGTNASAAMPNNVTVAIRWITNYRGRSYRGRTFHLGLVDNQVTGNTLEAAHVTALQTAYNDLIMLNTDVGPAVLCVASLYSNGQQRAVGIATPVVSCVVDPTIDSQRRRLPGRGR